MYSTKWPGVWLGRTKMTFLLMYFKTSNCCMCNSSLIQINRVALELSWWATKALQAIHSLHFSDQHILWQPAAHMKCMLITLSWLWPQGTKTVEQFVRELCKCAMHSDWLFFLPMYYLNKASITSQIIGLFDFHFNTTFMIFIILKVV